MQQPGAEVPQAGGFGAQAAGRARNVAFVVTTFGGFLAVFHFCTGCAGAAAAAIMRHGLAGGQAGYEWGEGIMGDDIQEQEQQKNYWQKAAKALGIGLLFLWKQIRYFPFLVQKILNNLARAAAWLAGIPFVLSLGMLRFEESIRDLDFLPPRLREATIMDFLDWGLMAVGAAICLYLLSRAVGALLR